MGIQRRQGKHEYKGLRASEKVVGSLACRPWWACGIVGGGDLEGVMGKIEWDSRTGAVRGLPPRVTERSGPGQWLLRGERQDLLGGDHARAFFIAFVGLHLHQIVKGVV